MDGESKFNQLMTTLRYELNTLDDQLNRLAGDPSDGRAREALDTLDRARGTLVSLLEAIGDRIE